MKDVYIEALDIIINDPGDIPGRELRDQLRQRGFRYSRPSFYRMMSLMEDKKLITGYYRSRKFEGETIRIYCYKPLSQGVVTWMQHQSESLNNGR